MNLEYLAPILGTTQPSAPYIKRRPPDKYVVYVVTQCNSFQRTPLRMFQKIDNVPCVVKV